MILLVNIQPNMDDAEYLLTCSSCGHPASCTIHILLELLTKIDSLPILSITLIEPWKSSLLEG